MGVKVKGLDKLVKKLNKFGDDGERAVKRNIEFSATNIELNAIRRAPFEIAGIPTGIKQKIDKIISNGGLTAKVGVQGSDPFPLYVEVGTGLNFIELVNSDPVNYDEDIKDLARQFYVNGLGTLPARPYLFPSFFEERVKLIEELKKDLTELANKV